MYKVLIVYAPDAKVLKDTAGGLKKQFNRKEFSVVVKTAAEAVIPDLAAAELVILGSEKGENGDIHPDFSELQRALGGINLAGRVCGLFVAGAEPRPVRKFRQILKYSGITIFKNPLIVREGQESLAEWAGELISFFKDGLHE